MDRPDHADSPVHPIKRLGLSLAAIAEKSGVPRENISIVVNGHRHRLGADANLKIKTAFPTYELEEALDWKWPRLRLFPSQKKAHTKKARAS